MAAGCPSLNHESIHRAIRLLQHGCRQGIGGYDGEELRPQGVAADHGPKLLRREGHGSVVTLLRPRDLEEIAGHFVICETIEDPRNLERHTGPHQNVAHARQHGAVDGRQMRKLNFFQIINSYRIIVAFACQKDFNKVSCDAKFLELDRSVFRMRWQGLIGSSFRLPA